MFPDRALRAFVLLVVLVAVATGCTTDQRRRYVDAAKVGEAPPREKGRLLCATDGPEALLQWKLYAVQGVKNASTLSVADGALRVNSVDAAGLFYFTGAPLFDPRTEPLLAWRWRVSDLLPRATPLAPDLDNFPARLLVGFDSGWEGADALALQWKKKVEDATGLSPPPRAICYTFGGDMPQREAVDALFGQGRIVVINLRGREARAGRWYEEVRDVASDYRAIFGGAAPQVAALAIAADTHRVHATVESDFAAIRVFTGAAYAQFRTELKAPPEREASPLALWLSGGAACLAALLFGLWLMRARGRQA